MACVTAFAPVEDENILIACKGKLGRDDEGITRHFSTIIEFAGFDAISKSS